MLNKERKIEKKERKKDRKKRGGGSYLDDLQPASPRRAVSLSSMASGGRAGGRDAQKTHRHLDGRTRRLLQNFSLQASLESSVRLERSVSGDPSWRDTGALGASCVMLSAAASTRVAPYIPSSRIVCREHIRRYQTKNSLWCLIMITNYITKYINI